MTKAYVIAIDTVLEGRVASVRDSHGKPYLYTTIQEAQRDIAESALLRLQEFLDGQRDFEDAIEVEEFIIEVTKTPEGIMRDESAQVFE